MVVIDTSFDGPLQSLRQYYKWQYTCGNACAKMLLILQYNLKAGKDQAQYKIIYLLSEILRSELLQCIHTWTATTM